MKYIRTKDKNNLIIDLTNMLLPYNLTDEYIDFNKFGMFKIVKQADTIKELCDEFVVVRENGEPMIVSLELAKEYAKCSITTYGAIWTDKGLIYVAKMNEKGELELL